MTLPPEVPLRSFVCPQFLDSSTARCPSLVPLSIFPANATSIVHLALAAPLSIHTMCFGTPVTFGTRANCV